MIDRGLAVCSLFFLAALTPTMSAATDDGVRVKVERPRLVPDTVLDPNARLNLAFDARFTNQGSAPVEVPARASAEDVAGISRNGLDSQQSDGSWRTVEGGGDLMWKVDAVFPRCRLLNPQETFEVKGVYGPFVVFKSNLKGLAGTTATLRLHLLLPCTQSNGKQVLKDRENEPIRSFDTALP